MKKAKPILDHTFVFIFLIFFTSLTSLSVLANPLSIRIANHDSSMFQYFGYAMSKGDALYVDIFDHKGPIIFILNYFGNLFSDGSHQGIWIFEWIGLFLFFWFTYRSARFWCNRVLSFIPIIFFTVALPNLIEGGNLTEEFALPCLAYSLYVFIKFYHQEQSVPIYEIFLSGVCFALSFLLRPNIIGIWIAYCAFIFFQLLFSQKHQQLLRFIVAFLAGIAILVTPILIYLWKNQALAAAFFQTWTFNVMYLDHTAGDWQQNFFSQLNVLNRYGFLFFAFFYVGVVKVSWKNFTKEQRLFHLATFFALFLSAYFTFLSGRAYKHYLMMLLPILMVPIVSCFSLLDSLVTKSRSSFFLLVMITLSLVAPIYDNYRLYMSINSFGAAIAEKNEGIANSRIKYQEEKERLLDVASWIKAHSSVSDRIYVHRLGGNVYLESERLASVKYFNLPAVNLDENRMIGTDFLQEFKQSETELVIISSSFNKHRSTAVEEQFYQFVLEHYEEKYNANGYVGFKRVKD